jgi:hypothetical protein
MGVSRAVDMYYTFRFLKTLVTDWKDMDAYDEGIIDKDGKNLIKYKDLNTNNQKDAYTTFHRLVFNIKRILEKIPFGRSKLASYAAALFLLREETGMSEDDIMSALEELGYEHNISDETNLLESTFSKGEYILNVDINEEFKKGTVITIDDTRPIGKFSNTLIYKTKENCFITIDNLT